MSPETRKWLTPANVLTIVGILVGAVVGVFGVAFANPTGQRLLCNLNAFFCDDVKISQIGLSGEAFDFGAWCEQYVRDLMAMPELDRPPGTGSFPTSADCTPDLGAPDSTARFRQPLGEIPQGSDQIVLVSLSIRHATPERETPFTIDLLCGYKRFDDRRQDEIPCDLQPMELGGDLGWPEPEPPDAGRSPRVALDPDAAYFARSWRLRIYETDTTQTLPAGDYSVSINIARDGEAVQQAEATLVFAVGSPGGGPQ